MSGHGNFKYINEHRFRVLAEMFQEDTNAFALYVKEGIIDSDELKASIQRAIDATEHVIPNYVPELRKFLQFVIRTGERGPQKQWSPTESYEASHDTTTI